LKRIFYRIGASNSDCAEEPKSRPNERLLKEIFSIQPVDFFEGKPDYLGSRRRRRIKALEIPYRFAFFGFRLGSYFVDAQPHIRINR
jgi:hypothetical protein